MIIIHYKYIFNPWKILFCNLRFLVVYNNVRQAVKFTDDQHSHNIYMYIYMYIYICNCSIAALTVGFIFLLTN